MGKSKCPFCDKTFDTPGRMRIHAGKVHGKKFEVLWAVEFKGFSGTPIPVTFWEAIREMAVAAIENQGKIFKEKEENG